MEFFSENSSTNESTVFRSIKIDDHHHHEQFQTFGIRNIGSPNEFLSKSNVSSGKSVETVKKDATINIKVVPTVKLCPSKPVMVLKTHFKLDTLSFDQNLNEVEKFYGLISGVETCLKNFSEYDFSYFEKEAMWKGKYIQGANLCEVHISIYSETSTVFIVEGKSVKGDRKPFNTFFRDLKCVLTKTKDVSRPTNNLFCASMPSSTKTDEQFLEGIRCIFTMAREPFIETKLEAAKMICELTAEDHQFLTLQDCKTGVISSLELLVADEDEEDIRQLGVVALAQFSEIPGYQAEIIRCSVLSNIFLLADDVPVGEPAYETAQVRREAGRILANITSYDPCRIVKLLQDKDVPVEDWMKKELSDERLRIHAIKAKNHMKKCLEVCCD